MGPASGKVNVTPFAMVGSGGGGGRAVDWDDARRWAPRGVKAHAVSQLFDSLDILVGLCVLDGVQAPRPLFLLRFSPRGITKNPHLGTKNPKSMPKFPAPNEI